MSAVVGRGFAVAVAPCVGSEDHGRSRKGASRGMHVRGPPRTRERCAALAAFERDPNGYLVERQRLDEPFTVG